MKNILNKKLILILILTSVLLAACSSDKQKVVPKTKIIVAKLQTPTSQLTFSGVLQPLKTYPVLSPVDGRITQLMLAFGDRVTKDQTIAILSSQQLADDYRKAINDYLKSKNAYQDAIQSYQGSEVLFNAGILAKSEFITAQSSYENAILSYFQARYDLEKVLRVANVDPKEIEKLTLADTTVINRLLQRKFTRIIIKAPGTGIALYPEASQSDSSSSDSSSGSTTLAIGANYKTGQLILSIGDLTGLSIPIQVSEISINRLKVGMPATITGAAFPTITLKGKIKSISYQAEPSQSGSALSMFNVSIVVPILSANESDIVHVGMTAKIQINLTGKPSILLPINAVHQQNGSAYVLLQGKNNQPQKVFVTTGPTTPEGQVIILAGVKAGDKVIVND